MIQIEQTVYKMVDTILQANQNSKDLSETAPFRIKAIYSQDGWELMEDLLIKDRILYILLHNN